MTGYSYLLLYTSSALAEASTPRAIPFTASWTAESWALWMLWLGGILEFRINATSDQAEDQIIRRLPWDWYNIYAAADASGSDRSTKLTTVLAGATQVDVPINADTGALDCSGTGWGEDHNLKALAISDVGLSVQNLRGVGGTLSFLAPAETSKEPAGSSIFGSREYLIEFNNSNGNDLTVGSPEGWRSLAAEEWICPEFGEIFGRTHVVVYIQSSLGEQTTIAFPDRDLDLGDLGGTISWSEPKTLAKVVTYQIGLAVNVQGASRSVIGELPSSARNGALNCESGFRMEVVERSLRETTVALHEAQGRQAAELAKSLEGLTRRSTGVVDVKGVGKPDHLKGHLKGSHEEVKKVWKTWSYKMETWFCSQYPEIGQKVLDWAKLRGDAAIMESDIQTFAQSEKLKLEDVQGLDAHLHVALVSLTSDMAYGTVYNSRKKSGLDAWRRLSHVYEPLNPRSNMRLLRRILVQPRSTLENLRSAIDRWEASILEYTQRGNQDLSDVAKITGLMAMCPENLEDHLELNIGRLDTYAKMRSEVVSYTEQKYAKTDAESGDAAPMELDAFKGKGAKGKGGKGGKGKGQDKSKDKDTVCHLCQKKGHRKADCWHNPANGGNGKPQAKPKGQNDSKDKSAKGKGKKGKAHTLEGEEDQQWPAEEGAATEAEADGALGSLCVYSGSGGSRCVSHRSPGSADAGDDEFEEIEVEEGGEDAAPSYAAHHYVPPHRRGLSAKSAAKPRASRPQGDEEEFEYVVEEVVPEKKAAKFKPPEPKGPPPGYRPKPEVVAKNEQESEESSEEKPMGYVPPHRRKGSGGAASSSMRAPSLKDDVKEEQSPGQEDKPKKVNFVVDSGASATTIPLSLVGDRRLDPAVGVEKFRLADGNAVENKGCLKARAWLQGGETLLATMSVADIHQPLLSVSQLIEKGNTVVMHKDRAYVETASGIKHRVYLRGGVFMLPVWLDLSELGVEEESEGAMEQGLAHTTLVIYLSERGARIASVDAERATLITRSSGKEREGDPEEIPVFSIDYGFFGAPGEIQE
eukprot:s1121_g7.t1